MNKSLTYLKLKFIIGVREIEHFGISIYIAVPLLIIVYSLLVLEISTAVYGAYFLVSLNISALIAYNCNRNDKDQLKLYFKTPEFIYATENLIITFPFIISALYLACYWTIIVFILASFILAYYQPTISSLLFLEKLNLSLLVPDMEFISGIRKYWFGHLLGVILIVLGIVVKNVNISLFGYTIYLLTCGVYYQIIEKIEWIWAYPVSPKKYIENKITSILKKLFLFSVVWVFIFLFWTRSFEILLYTISIFIAILNIMLSKYAKYNTPISVQISQGISLAFCVAGFVYPYLFTFNIIYFYFLKKQAIKTLEIILHVKDS